MTTSEVYSETTVPNPRLSWFQVPSENLDKTRFGIKLCEVLLSLLAVILEELVHTCALCSSLYFFEFVSCTAFLFTLLLVILLTTPLHTRVGINWWPRLDFVYSAAICLLFFIASISFTVQNGNTTVERSAVIFGYLASVLFLADIVFFMKSHGFPFNNKSASAELSNGGVVVPPSETERLNTA